MSYSSSCDIGHTYTKIGIFKDGNALVETNNFCGSKYFPSIIWNENNNWEFGQYIPGCIDNIKQKLVDQENSTDFLFNGKKYSAVDAVSKYISFAYKSCECNFQNEKTVITIPASYTQKQREATLAAFLKAGFNYENIQIITEPSAAALSFCLLENNKNKSFNNLVVIDSGGATTDIAIFNISYQNGIPIFMEKYVEGNQHLGGKNIDQNLFDYVMDKLRPFGINDLDPFDDFDDIITIRKSCEEAKKKLSYSPNQIVDILRKKAWIQGKRIPENITIDIDTFETINNSIFNQIIQLLNTTLNNANVRVNDVDGVLIVGGNSNNRKVKQLVENYFNKEIFEYPQKQDAVAIGACLLAASKSPNANIVSGMKFINSENHNQQTGIPIFEVLSHSLGISIRNESNPNRKKFSAILKKGVHHFGDHAYDFFYTIEDNQEVADISIFECDGDYIDEGKLWKCIQHKNLTPRPKGKTEIKITLTIEFKGIVTVKSEEIGSYNDLVIQFLYKNIKESGATEKQEIIIQKKYNYTMLLAIDRFFKEKLPELTNTLPEFKKKVSIKDLESIHKEVTYCLESIAPASNNYIYQLITKGREIISPYYIEKKMKLPDVFADY